MEHEEFGDEGVAENAPIQGVLGDAIPLEAVDPTQDPHIIVDEVIFYQRE